MVKKTEVLDYIGKREGKVKSSELTKKFGRSASVIVDRMTKQGIVKKEKKEGGMEVSVIHKPTAKPSTERKETEPRKSVQRKFQHKEPPKTKVVRYLVIPTPDAETVERWRRERLEAERLEKLRRQREWEEAQRKQEIADGSRWLPTRKIKLDGKGIEVYSQESQITFINQDEKGLLEKLKEKIGEIIHG